MIYSIIKKLEISASHQLSLSYESKCGRLHGHNWTITVYLASTSLNEDGMVADFTQVKRAIHGYLDHGNLNELLSFNPTAENLAAWVVSQFPECYKAVVEESSGNTAQAVDEQFPIDLKFLAL
jgi:6-pyruvoyltetrahydropterin/6-carboxytetrahydropterin synthase